MDRAEYNAMVQDMQEFCISAGVEHRVKAHHDGDGKICQADFEVYYGDWHTLGVEYRPMSPDTVREYREYDDARLRAMVARDISA